MAKRVKFGDIIQILTSEGVAYAQYTHKHEEYGYLLAIFEGFYNKEPKDFSEVVNQTPQFWAFFPLQTAINQGLFSVVGNVAVAEENQNFPLFRKCQYTKEGKRVNWSIWDGKISTRLERELSEEEKRYSMEAIISAPLLVERIQTGYRPEKDDA